MYSLTFKRPSSTRATSLEEEGCSIEKQQSPLIDLRSSLQPPWVGMGGYLPRLWV